MTFRNTLAAATLLALPLAAQAQPVDGPYVALGGGLNIMQQVPVKSVLGTQVPDSNISTNLGGVGILSGGWGFGNGLRAELEFDYRYNRLDSLHTPIGSASLKGSERKFGPMVNVFYDFTTLTPVVTPYVGVGAGYQWSVENVKIQGVSGWARETEGAFAYQAIAGAAVPISAVPGLAATAEYRFMGLTGRAFSGDLDSLKLGNDFNHSVLVGLRYAFGAPAAPAPVASPAAEVPASPISRSYLVFFDWDKAILTDRARQIVAEAAANSTKVQYTRIEVNGYTDTSGTPKYNQGLSVRRAQAVAAELVKDGVPKSAISIQGFGETHPLVQTGPGVREPQNRRVEIIVK
jgi:OOP family OmpA-OmpF porin